MSCWSLIPNVTFSELPFADCIEEHGEDLNFVDVSGCWILESCWSASREVVFFGPTSEVL